MRVCPFCHQKSLQTPTAPGPPPPESPGVSSSVNATGVTSSASGASGSAASGSGTSSPQPGRKAGSQGWGWVNGLGFKENLCQHLEVLGKLLGWKSSDLVLFVSELPKM